MGRAIQIANQLFAGRTLSAKAYLNSLASTLEFLARVIVNFVVTPILVEGLGDSLFGVWKVVQRTTDYVTVTGGRSSQALKWFVTAHQGSSDDQEKRRAVGGATVVWLLLLPLQSLVAIAIVWQLPGWMSVAPEFAPAVRLASSLVAFGLISSNLFRNARNVLEGENLGYKRMWVAPALICLGGGLTVLAIRFDLGLAGVALAGLFTVLATELSCFWITRRFVPWFGIARPTRETFRHFFRLSGWFLGWHIVVRFMLSSDVLILGVLASSQLVTVYTLTRYMPEAVFRFVSTLVFQTTPGLGAIIGRGELARASAIRGEVMTLLWLATTTTGSTLLLWNHPFLNLWVEGIYFAGWLPTLLIILMTSQMAMIRFDGNVIDISLKLRGKVILGVISLALALSLSILFVGRFESGILGLCTGIILGRLVLTFSYPMLVGRMLKISWVTQLYASVRPTLVLLSMFGVCGGLAPHASARNWIELLFSAGATFAATGSLAWFTGLTTAQRDRIRKRVARFTGPKP